MVGTDVGVGVRGWWSEGFGWSGFLGCYRCVEHVFTFRFFE